MTASGRFRTFVVRRSTGPDHRGHDHLWVVAPRAIATTSSTASATAPGLSTCMLCIELGTIRWLPRVDRPDRQGHAHVMPLPLHPRTLLDVRDLKVYFPVRTDGWLGRKKALRAVDGVSFQLHEGETLGVVGESGCGKSTLARAVLRLLPKTDGAVVWCGRDLGPMQQEEIRKLREELQIVFQDPLASLDPRMTIGQSIAEPLRTLKPELSRGDVRREVGEMMERVGLEPGWINRYPHEFSGGQNQRVGIARAMIVRPRLVWTRTKMPTTKPTGNHRVTVRR